MCDIGKYLDTVTVEPLELAGKPEGERREPDPQRVEEGAALKQG